MTWHSEYTLPRVKASPCGPSLLPFLLLLRKMSEVSSFSSSLKFFLLQYFLSFFIVVSVHMEGNRRRNRRPNLLSNDPQDRYLTESTQTDSASSYDMPLDDVADDPRHCATPFPLEDSTRWTDWQHNLYLNSLEASFVNQMRHSMNLRGCQRVPNNLNEVDISRTSQKPRNLSGQFLNLQDGFRKEVSHEGNEPVLESTGDSHVLTGSPLKFTSVERGCVMRDFSVHHGEFPCDEGHRRGKSVVSGRSRTSSEQHDLYYPESSATTADLVEVTDQNFKDEDQGAPSSGVPIHG